MGSPNLVLQQLAGGLSQNKDAFSHFMDEIKTATNRSSGCGAYSPNESQHIEIKEVKTEY